MRYLLVKGQGEDVGRIIHKPLGQLCIRLSSFQVITRNLDGLKSTGLRGRYQNMV